MSVADALREAGAKATGKRPYFLNPEVERVLAITMAMAQELAIVRQRLDTVERLLAANTILSRTDIENFVPGPDAATERAMWNQEYIARILRIVQQENEAAAIGREAVSGEMDDAPAPAE